MLRTTLAGLRLHKGRLVTTVLAIVLGVAFTTGTLVFTDTLKESFAVQVMGSMDQVDVIAFPADPDYKADPEAEPVLFDAATVEKVRALPEVSAATGIIHGTAPLLNADGRSMGVFPTAGLSVGGDVARYQAVEGRLPQNDGEAALATLSADQGGFAVGDTVTALDPEGDKHEFTVTGLILFGLDPDISYRGAIAFAPETAEWMVEADGHAEIHVRAAEGLPLEHVETAVAKTLGDTADVLNGSEYGQQLAKEAGADAAIMGTALLLFAAVAMFVAALVIYNTFAILIAQRQREMALLRCVGAVRGQVFRGVLLESLIVGLIASTIGVVVGIGLGAAGFTLGSGLANGSSTPIAPVVSAGPIVAGLLVGTLVTLISALLPALRATRVPPLAALRTSATADGLEKGIGWFRVGVGSLFFLATAAMLAVSLALGADQSAMVLVAGSGMVCFIGVLIISPLLVRAVVAVLGWPLRRTGVTSALAVDNTMRSPKRAAAAMIALTVGATLITGYSVISSSLSATLDSMMTERFPVDYVLSQQLNFDLNDKPEVIPAEVITELKASPLIGSAFTQLSAVDANGVSVSAYPDAELGVDIGAGDSEGDISDVRSGSVAVTAEVARELDVGLGQSMALETEEGKKSVTVVSVLPDNSGLYGVLVSAMDFEALFPGVDHDSLYVRANEGASMRELTELINSAVADHPTIQVVSMVESKSEFTQVLDTVFLVIAALLGLAILIAVFGIANTMALSVLERRRESALLRALGLSKAQLRRMLVTEAVLVSVVGAGLGIALGTLFGWAAGRATISTMSFSLPVAEIAGFLAVAVVAGLLAAAVPAQRAARTSITGALASE